MYQYDYYRRSSAGGHNIEHAIGYGLGAAVMLVICALWMTFRAIARITFLEQLITRIYCAFPRASILLVTTAVLYLLFW